MSFQGTLIRAEQERSELQQSQLCVCMYVSMYAVTLQECNNYARMRLAKPRVERLLHSL